MGSRNNLDRDGGKRPVFTLAKISQRLFFRSPPAFLGNSAQTFVDHGRVVLRYGLGRSEDHLAPEEQVPRGLPPVRAWRVPGRHALSAQSSSTLLVPNVLLPALRGHTSARHRRY